LPTASRGNPRLDAHGADAPSPAPTHDLQIVRQPAAEPRRSSPGGG